MNETLSGAVAAIRVTGDVLGEAGHQLPAVDPGVTAFGAGGFADANESARSQHRDDGGPARARG